ncbi:MAG: hypothetical protein M3Z46_01235, partial [Actinomycetota bacterium]|nr:hypothetical protein [Actinomycetota bacterium]
RASLAERRRPELQSPATVGRGAAGRGAAGHGSSPSAPPPPAPPRDERPPDPAGPGPAATTGPDSPAISESVTTATGPDTESGPPAAFTREGLTLAWADKVLPTLGGLAKAMYGVGRFLEVQGSTAVFALPNEAHRRKCEQKRAEVEVALAAAGMPATLRLVVDDGRPGERPDDTADRSGVGQQPTGSPEVEEDFTGIDVRELEDAPDDRLDGVARLTAAFPGAELVQHDEPG